MLSRNLPWFSFSYLFHYLWILRTVNYAKLIYYLRFTNANIWQVLVPRILGIAISSTPCLCQQNSCPLIIMLFIMLSPMERCFLCLVSNHLNRLKLRLEIICGTLIKIMTFFTIYCLKFLLSKRHFYY